MRTRPRSARPPARATALPPAPPAPRSPRPGTRMRRAPGISCLCLTVTSVAPGVSLVSLSALGTPSHPHLGGSDEVPPPASASLLCSPVVHFLSCRGHSGMPAPAALTFDLGTLQLGSSRSGQGSSVAPGPSRPALPLSSSFVSPNWLPVLYQLPCPRPTPRHASVLRGLSGRSFTQQSAVWLCLDAVKRFFFPVSFLSLHHSDFKLTKRP